MAEGIGSVVGGTKSNAAQPVGNTIAGVCGIVGGLNAAWKRNNAFGQGLPGHRRQLVSCSIVHVLVVDATVISLDNSSKAVVGEGNSADR